WKVASETTPVFGRAVEEEARVAPCGSARLPGFVADGLPEHEDLGPALDGPRQGQGEFRAVPVQCDPVRAHGRVGREAAERTIEEDDVGLTPPMCLDALDPRMPVADSDDRVEQREHDAVRAHDG